MTTPTNRINLVQLVESNRKNDEREAAFSQNMQEFNEMQGTRRKNNFVT